MYVRMIKQHAKYWETENTVVTHQRLYDEEVFRLNVDLTRHNSPLPIISNRPIDAE